MGDEIPACPIAVGPSRLILSIAFVGWLATDSINANAKEIDTKHLCGFTIGTDVGEIGDREIGTDTTGRFGKRDGSYAAFSPAMGVEFTPTRDFLFSVGVAAARHDISQVTGLDDRRQWAFQAITAEMKYRLLDRDSAPFGLAIDVAPYWGRVDETSGEPINRYAADLALALDKEVVPGRIVTAFNVLYGAATTYSRVTGEWSQQSSFGLTNALMGQVRPRVFIGAEVRYLRNYEGLGLDVFAGHALFVGPTLFAQLSERWWMAAAWSVQVAGRAADDPGSLDLTNFERHQARLKLGVSF